MKNFSFLLIAALFLISCNNGNKPTNSNEPIEEEATNFFPVTSYVKGQINEIKNGGINPLKITSVNAKVDSALIKIEEIDSLFSEFLTPEIDSANMIEFFRESKFLDQTLNTFTFTYEPKIDLPATVPLKRWDVYVSPETNRVKRVYLEKYSSDKKYELQLSWQADKNCRIVYISTDSTGTQKIVKEELIKWNFDQE